MSAVYANILIAIVKVMAFFVYLCAKLKSL